MSADPESQAERLLEECEDESGVCTKCVAKALREKDDEIERLGCKYTDAAKLYAEAQSACLTLESELSRERSAREAAERERDRLRGRQQPTDIF